MERPGGERIFQPMLALHSPAPRLRRPIFGEPGQEGPAKQREEPRKTGVVLKVFQISGSKEVILKLPPTELLLAQIFKRIREAATKTTLVRKPDKVVRHVARTERGSDLEELEIAIRVFSLANGPYVLFNGCLLRQFPIFHVAGQDETRQSRRSASKEQIGLDVAIRCVEFLWKSQYRSERRSEEHTSELQ